MTPTPPAPSQTFVVERKPSRSLTNRNRFILWRAVHQLMCSIDMDICAMAEPATASDEPYVLNEFPRCTRGQSVEWWELVYAAAERMENALRLGGSAMIPRTVAEEAVLAVPLRSGDVPGYAEGAMYPEILAQFEALEGSDGDYDYNPKFNWRNVLPDLTDDMDIEMLWEPAMDGVESPDDEINVFTGMGDYRPAEWHTLFLRAEGDQA